MPEAVASCSFQRFSALLDFQRDVDLAYPSHAGQQNPPQNCSESSTPVAVATPRAAPSPRPCAVEAAKRRSNNSSFFTLTRSHGQFSPQRFIRHALKRAFATDDDFTMNAKRARFQEFRVPMVCG